MELHEGGDVSVPPLIYVANKCEDEFEGDVMCDVWRLDVDEPLFISAEHGDGLQDLLG